MRKYQNSYNGGRTSLKVLTALGLAYFTDVGAV
jgi:hypothetical protein